jgi:hypothetical protein
MGTVGDISQLAIESAWRMCEVVCASWWPSKFKARLRSTERESSQPEVQRSAAQAQSTGAPLDGPHHQRRAVRLFVQQGGMNATTWRTDPESEAINDQVSELRAPPGRSATLRQGTVVAHQSAILCWPYIARNFIFWSFPVAV